MPRKQINPPMNIYKKIAISFIVLTLILIGIIFYFTLSYAFITVYPAQEELETEFKFIIVNDESLENVEEGIFSGIVINKELEGEKTFTTTGTKLLAGDTVGKVVLTNNRIVNQPLVATTRLLTNDGLLFRLEEAVNIPANGTLEASVYPDDPSQDLVNSGTKFTIPGLSESMQELVYAEAKTDFKPEGEEVSAISQDELDAAVEELANDLIEENFKENTNQLTKILSKEILSTEYSNEVGEEVDEYSLKLKINLVGVMFESEAIEKYAKEILDSVLSTDKELISSNESELVYKIEKHDLDNKLVQVKSSISGLARISLNSAILDRDKLIKLNLNEIEAYLENTEEIDNAEVNFFPAWVKKVPYFQDHIIIRIAE